MKGDVALAGIVFSADDWAAYEPVVRAELLAAASIERDQWVVTSARGVLSGPIRIPAANDDR